MNTTSNIVAKDPTFHPGDKVAYSTQFLETMDEGHGEMAAGCAIVRERDAVTEDFVLIFVEWQGRSLPQRVRESNFAKVGPNSGFCKC